MLTSTVLLVGQKKPIEFILVGVLKCPEMVTVARDHDLNDAPVVPPDFD
jgi:hypothetical protein